MISSQSSFFEADSQSGSLIDYYPDFFKTHCKSAEDLMFDHCKKLNWEQNRIRTSKVPHLETLYGDSNIHYEYSGVTLQSNGWDDWLKRLRDIIEEFSGYQFNYAIGNLYQDEKDSIGWHDDAKPELGSSPAIASISLGAVRRFQYRLKPSGSKPNGPIETIHMAHGSLVLMHPGFQEDYIHQVPKEKTGKQPRINWTYRRNL